MDPVRQKALRDNQSKRSEIREVTGTARPAQRDAGRCGTRGWLYSSVPKRRLGECFSRIHEGIL